jgi:hypothetical protein
VATKTCNTCYTAKALCDFSLRAPGGKRRNRCKSCTASNSKAYYDANTEASRARSLSRYYQNKKAIMERHVRYCRDRYHRDVQFRLRLSLRNRLGDALGGKGARPGSAVRDLGCSIGDLKAHLERGFHDGMSWENYGQWHIDHIMPLAMFDLTNRAELLRAFNYTNLQPLWREDNLRKGKKHEAARACGMRDTDGLLSPSGGAVRPAGGTEGDGASPAARQPDSP